jgi:adenylate kinase family enzyme
VPRPQARSAPSYFPATAGSASAVIRSDPDIRVTGRETTSPILLQRVSSPQRILVYGVTGSGKTTLARRIGEITGLPWHSMDDEVGWLPGWVERPVEDQVRMVARLVASESWVLDTAYGHWRDLVLARADLVVALDYPRWVSLTRLVGRTMRRAFTRETACNGNIETWRKVFSSDSILVWHFRSFARKRSRIAAWEADLNAPSVVRLRSPFETERWLTALRNEHR